MAFYSRPIVRLERVERDVAEPRPRHHNNIEAGRTRPRLVEAEDLSNETLRPIPDDCAPKTPCRHDSESGGTQIVREHEQCDVAPPRPDAMPLHPQELWPTPEPLSASEGSVHSN